MTSDSPNTVIIGAGIIGCATAYFLSQSEQALQGNIHLIEASPELFASASGKSGGFCVADWFGPQTASLGKLSFQLHRELASQFDGHKNWGYSSSTSASLVASSNESAARGEDWLFNGSSRAEAAAVHEVVQSQNVPAWLLQQKDSTYELIGDEGSVAQVDPLRLCQFLLRKSVEQGTQLHQPVTPVRVIHDHEGMISGVAVRKSDGTVYNIACTRLLLSAGAWTARVFQQLFPDSSLQLPITSLAGHSLVVSSPHWTQKYEARGCHAVFTTTSSGISPEIFSRIGGEIYVAGLNDASLELPDLATDAQVDPSCIEHLKTVARDFVRGEGAEASHFQVVREGLCFRPVTRSGVPILTRIADKYAGVGSDRSDPARGVFIAAGHGPWGISHSLGTGKVMSELLEGTPASADIDSLGLRQHNVI